MNLRFPSAIAVATAGAFVLAGCATAAHASADRQAPIAHVNTAALPAPTVGDRCTARGLNSPLGGVECWQMPAQGRWTLELYTPNGADFKRIGSGGTATWKLDGKANTSVPVIGGDKIVVTTPAMPWDNHTLEVTMVRPAPG